MGKDCDYRSSIYCFSRITYSARFFIKIPEELLTNFFKKKLYKTDLIDDDIYGMLIFPEGMCIECFLCFIDEYFNNDIIDSTDNIFVPNEQFCTKLKQFFPEFDKEKHILKWYGTSQYNVHLDVNFIKDYIRIKEEKEEEEEEVSYYQIVSNLIEKYVKQT